MKCFFLSSAFSSALIVLTALSLCTLLHASEAPQGRRKAQHETAITAPPSAEHIASEKAAQASQKATAHEADVKKGVQVAYIAILRGKDFPLDKSQFVVRINGVPTTEVFVLNSKAFSFRIPDTLVLDRERLTSSSVEVFISGEKHTTVPLIVLEEAITKVDLAEFRGRAEKSHKESLAERENVATNDDDDTAEDEDLDDLEDNDEEWNPDNDVIDTSKVDSEPPKTVQDDGPKSTETAEDNAEAERLVSRAEELLSDQKRASTKESVRILEHAITEGNVRAMTILGSALLSGTAVGLSRNVSRAVSYLQAASDKGYPDAQAMLGFLYASGIAGTALRKDIGAALLMWTFAAEGGSMYAKMALGYRYFTGTDIAEDCEKASEYYKDVAGEVFQEARESLDRQTGRQREAGHDDDDTMAEIRPPTPSAILTSDRKRLTEGMVRRVMGESNEVVQYYRHSAERGEAGAQVVMGNLYYYGAIDMPQDIDRARKLFTQAARTGRPEAHAHLGFMDLRAGRNASAVSHLKKAASHDDHLGLHGMGFVTLHGIGVEKDPALAADYFTKAAEKKHPESLFNLAIMYSKGIGVPPSSQEAFRLFQSAARHGHMQSNYNVGIMFLRGLRPAPKDCNTATKYLKLVSQQGVWNSILSKAFRAYERGAYADALFRYLQAAHAGIELAQFNAAFMYEHKTLSNNDGFSMKSVWGSGEEHFQDLLADRNVVIEEAIELYQMSATQEHWDSFVRMGDLVFAETKDFPRAVAAYEQAKNHENAEAMFNLGWMHARGFGMNPDSHMAKRYFDLAKEKNRDAFLPATIAVYFLQYSESMSKYLDKISAFLARMGRSTDATEEKEVSNWIELMNLGGIIGTADVIVLIVLLFGLGIVLRVRKRRLAATRDRQEVTDHGGNSDIPRNSERQEIAREPRQNIRQRNTGRIHEHTE